MREGGRGGKEGEREREREREREKLVVGKCEVNNGGRSLASGSKAISGRS